MHTLITVGIIVLVVVLITAILIPVMKKMTQQSKWEYELRRDGVTVQGHVIGHDIRYGKGPSYMLTYRYLYDGVSYEREAWVPESDYEAHQTGTEISVICHPRHPKLAHLLINGQLDGWIAY